jgi:hypothetical protein
MTRRRAAGSLAALTVLCLPVTPAAAATLTIDRPCVAEGERATFRGADLTPGAAVRLTLAREGRPVLAEATGPLADAAGRVSWVYGFPRRTTWFDGGETRFRMTATAGTATTALTFARRDVRIQAPSGRIAPDRAATIRADGFASQRGKRLYAHWLRAGERRKSVSLGRLAGACGSLTRRLSRGFPFRPVDPGTWHVAFNTSRTNPRAPGTVVQRAARVKHEIP